MWLSESECDLKLHDMSRVNSDCQAFISGCKCHSLKKTYVHVHGSARAAVHVYIHIWVSCVKCYNMKMLQP